LMLSHLYELYAVDEVRAYPVQRCVDNSELELQTFELSCLRWHFKKRKKSGFWILKKKRKKRILELWF